MKHYVLIAFLLVATVVIAGCTAPESVKNTEKNSSMMEKDSAMKNTSEMNAIKESMQNNMTNSAKAEDLEKLAKNYYRYDPVAFQEALDAKKVIFLDFHANWCPICNSEHPAITEGFNEMTYDDVIGFQVHYNDDETKSFDRDLIGQYQVAYQHTKVIIGKDGKTLLKTLESFSKEKMLQEIEKARSL